MKRCFTQCIGAIQCQLGSLVDLKHLSRILSDFSSATGFTTGLVSSHDSKLILTTGWRNICVDFHRAVPRSSAHCRFTTFYLTDRARRLTRMNIRQCGNGLIEAGIPIIVRDQCMGILVTGQVAFVPPDLERFRIQARQYGFDEKAYLDALRKVPVVSKGQIRSALEFLGGIVQMIVDKAIVSLEAKDQVRKKVLKDDNLRRVEKALREREAQFRALIDTPRTGFVLLNAEGLVLESNAEYIRLTGRKSATAILGHSVLEWTADAEKERNAQMIRQCLRDGLVRDLEMHYVDEAGHVTPVEINATVLNKGKSARILSLCHDITHRKQIVDALQTQERQLRSILEGIPDLVFMVDREERIIFINKQAALFLGSTPECLLGKRQGDCFPPEEAARNSSVIQAVFLGIPQEMEERAFRIPHQPEHWFETQLVPMFDKQDFPQFILGIARDISKRKLFEKELKEHQDHLEELVKKRTLELSMAKEQLEEINLNLEERVKSRATELIDANASLKQEIRERARAEKALQTSEATYRELVENLNDIIFIAGLNGNLRYTSPAVERVTGYSPSEFLGNHFSQWVVAEDLKAVEKLFQKDYYQENRPQEFRIVCKDGRVAWLRASSRPVFDGNRLAGIQGTVTEITSAKQAEEALMESEERFKALANAAQEGILFIERGRITDGNEMAMEIVRTPRHEVIGRPLKRMFAPEFQKRISAPLQSFSPPFEGEIIRGDGIHIWVKISIRRTQYQGKHVSIVTIQDLTEQCTAKKGLQEANERLHHLTALLQTAREEEKSKISRMVHDQLGQLLTALKMDLSCIETQFKEVSTTQEVELHDIFRCAKERLDNGLETVRNICRELRPPLLDDLGLIPALEWQARDFGQRTGLACTFKNTLSRRSFPQELSNAIFRILQEGLTNVARHAEASHVDIHLGNYRGCLVLEIRDDGKGILPLHQENPESLGILGMRERVHQFDGRFHLSGRPGKGTRLRIEIPWKNIENDSNPDH